MSGIILGTILTAYGAWGVLAQEYSSDGYRWRNGLQLEGHQAVLTGAVILAAGVYVLYVSLTARKNDR